eukprot:gene37564-50708_t
MADKKPTKKKALAKTAKARTTKVSKSSAPKVKKAAVSKTQPLVAQAYESIKERIINLHFLPGQYLNEAAICAQLQLGRTPVHQALHRLHIE